MKLNMKYGDILVVDPCYIKNVTSGAEQRFDALRCVKVIHDGDDGEFDVYINGKFNRSIGVDSGRIWVLVAEFDAEVDVESGFSGHLFIENKLKTPEEKALAVERLKIQIADAEA